MQNRGIPFRVTGSETLTKVLIDEVVCCYRGPSTLHSDQGSTLNSEMITGLCKQLARKSYIRIYAV